MQDVELVLIYESIGRINFVPYPLQRLLDGEAYSPHPSGGAESRHSGVADL